jgi:formate hydrogenlyase subunit 3/multisubunit Na+/H+ antiporter MnhD subunit
VTGLVLPGLSCIAVALFAVALAAVGFASRLAFGGALVLSGAGAVLDIGGLVAGIEPATLYVPLGLPGSGILFGCDGLAASFLLIVLLVGAAASAAALDGDVRDDAAAPLVPAWIGAMLTTLLAADAFSCVVGFALTALVGAGLAVTDHRAAEARSAALMLCGVAAIGSACLVPAMAWLAHLEPSGVDLSFSGMRAHPAEGWRGAAVLTLTLVGAGGLAALAPLHIWLPPAQAAAPAPVAALLAGGTTTVALYLLVRLLFDLCGPAQPGWWGVPLLVLGAAGAVLGGLRANLESDMRAVLGCATVASVGLVAAGLGVALVARAADVPGLAALALAGALLQVMAHGLVAALLCLAAGAVQRGAGTRALARLGGLLQSMPVTGACVLVGAAGLAGLPPSSGFAAKWTLFQAVLSAPRLGGLALPMLFAAVALLLALAVALTAAAAVRLVGVAFLGRPRTPRAAAAQEAGMPARLAMLGLAGASLLIGLFPGLVLEAAEPALRALTGYGMSERASLLVVAPQASAPGYVAPGVALLLGIALAAVVAALRRGAVAGHRGGPAWEGGAAPPPPWLPFGDPATQYGAAGFAQILRRTLGTTLLAREPGETRAAGTSTLDDPAERFVVRPLRRCHAALSGLAERVQSMSPRQALAMLLGAVAAFLAFVSMAADL